MPIEEITEIMMAIGNHDENTGTAVSDISAALILADKSDVHRDRVVNKNLSTFDIHDRVNYAVTNADLIMNEKERKVTLNLTIDTKISPLHMCSLLLHLTFGFCFVCIFQKILSLILVQLIN